MLIPVELENIRQGPNFIKTFYKILKSVVLVSDRLFQRSVMLVIKACTHPSELPEASPIIE
jgi:hypothetical protein